VPLDSAAKSHEAHRLMKTKPLVDAFNPRMDLSWRRVDAHRLVRLHLQGQQHNCAELKACAWAAWVQM
jgi:hypothetical protein